MEKIIFFSLVIPIFGFVLYLGALAIMIGFSAINENIANEKINEFSDEKNLTDEIKKLDQLLKEGVLTQEEFEKAKKKILNN